MYEVIKKSDKIVLAAEISLIFLMGYVIRDTSASLLFKIGFSGLIITLYFLTAFFETTVQKGVKK